MFGGSLRILFAFVCVLGGSIAILKPKYASCSLLIAYIGFNVLIQVIQFYLLSCYDDIDELTLFKTWNNIKAFSYWSYIMQCVFVIVLSSKWIYLLTVTLMSYVTFAVLCSYNEIGKFYLVMVSDSFFVGIFTSILFCWVRKILLV
jgi:hypothetical protein